MWGSITGTLSTQTDLQSALNAKAATSHNHDGAYSVLGHTHAYQPVDADLTAIAALAGTGGYAKRTSADTWSIAIPTAADVGADATGTAAAAVAAHVAAADPHPAYVLDTDLSSHVAAADPHTVYQKESEKGSANGYAGLGANGYVPTANLGSGVASTTTFLRGDQSWGTPTASAAWGSITGTLSSQTDLQTALNGKASTAHAATHITGGSDVVPAFTASASGLVPASGGGTSNFLRADGTFAAPAGGSSPNWYGVVYGGYGDCDPNRLLEAATRNGTIAATPTNIANTVARISYFVPPANITVNKIRFLGVGATTNVYRCAIYNADTLARLTAELPFTTAVSTWGAAGSALNLSLVANQLYFIAVSVNATGTTAGCLCMSPTIAATTGLVAVLPKNWPGSLDIDSKYIKGGFAQFAVTAGALPVTAATIAVQAAWTGGFPAFWLDSNNV